MHRKAPVRPVLVVVRDVAFEHAAEMAFVHDEEAVGALRSDRSHPVLGDRVRVGCPDRTSSDPCTLALPHRVETRTELRVPVAQEELDVDAGIAEIRGHVASALGDPRPGGIRRDAGEEDPTRSVMDEEEDIEPAQRDRVDREREEVAGHDACGLLAEELPPGGRAAPWGGLEAVGLQHLGDRARRDPVSERKHLASDAQVPPSRVVQGTGEPTTPAPRAAPPGVSGVIS